MELINNPLVSVIIPAFNCEKFVNQALDSIINQTYQNLEIIVCDDASTDKTRKIIDSYEDSRIKRFHNEKNLGYLRTWNKLMELATGDYITFQDADDFSKKNRIEFLLKVFNANSNLGIVGSNYHRVDEFGKITYTSDFSLTHNDITSKFPEKFDIVGSGLMIKIKVYKEIGGYNTFFDRMGAEDYYWYFIASEKFNVANIKEPLYNYRMNSNSVSGDWSDNPKKMITASILNFLINQRIETGSDYLETGNLIELNVKMEELMGPYNEDPSLFYRQLAIKYFYSGNKKRSLHLAWKACIKNPLKMENIKNLIYFLRKNDIKYL